MEPWRLDVIAARDAVATGALSPVELAESCLDRIEAVDGMVGAWQAVDREIAVAGARAAEHGPLHGVPAGIKDVFNTRAYPTGMGNVQWAGHTAGNDARAVFNALRAGSFVLGKTVTADLGVHDPGPTRNPHDPSRSPGTSSSGTAAAVACGMVPWGLGSQSAGSIVRPASYCGVYGFKPSYGAIPRTGALKTTDTLDTVGVLCRSARDIRPLFEALRLHGSDHPYIHATLDRTAGTPELPADRPPRIALLSDGLGEIWDAARPDARRALMRFVARLTAEGAEVVAATPPPELRGAHALHATIYNRALAYYFRGEAERLDEIGPELTVLIERGRRIGLDEYTSALDRQHALRRVHDEWISGFDAAMTLSTAGTAPAWGAHDPVDSALVWTLCGAPSLSAPVLAGEDGMPLGLQLVGRRWHDHRLLDAVDWLTAHRLLPAAPVAHGRLSPPARAAA